MRIAHNDRLSNDDAYTLEKSIIKAIGVHRLTNQSSGFTTDHQKAIYLAQRALSRIKPYEVWLNERPHKQYDPAIYWRIVNEFKYIASGQFMRDIEARGGAIAL